MGLRGPENAGRARPHWHLQRRDGQKLVIGRGQAAVMEFLVFFFTISKWDLLVFQGMAVAKSNILTCLMYVS